MRVLGWSVVDNRVPPFSLDAMDWFEDNFASSSSSLMRGLDWFEDNCASSPSLLMRGLGWNLDFDRESRFSPNGSRPMFCFNIAVEILVF